MRSAKALCMGLPVDRSAARRCLDAAVDWAASGRPVPSEWAEWTTRVDASPSKTFTPALGTALLAKATNPSIDALALKATSGPEAYDARSVCHNVLVPGAVLYGYDLRANGREPLNNQPFFRYDRIDEIDRIKSNARPFLPVLISACQAINRLDAAKALAGLAAFLRIRIEAARARQVIHLRGVSASMRDLIHVTQEFITVDPEGGRRGQAFVAAAFDMVSAKVRSARVNDPSRRFPGDVQVLEDGVAVLAVEVRQKIVLHTDAVQFAESLKQGGVPTGLVAMLDPAQHELDAYDLLVDAESLHGVTLGVAYGVQDVLVTSAVWCGKPLDAVLATFPQRMLVRLDEIDASRAAVEHWARLFP